MESKILNGRGMMRAGRYDTVRNVSDDRLEVYVRTDDDRVLRVYVEHDGTTLTALVSDTAWHDKPIEALGGESPTLRLHEDLATTNH